METVADRLDSLAGARHVGVTATGRGSAVFVTADLATEAADSALELLDQLQVPTADVLLQRIDTIGPASGMVEISGVVWADLVSQARIQSRAPIRYFVFMAAAGVIAAFGVIDKSPVLIVGAMALSPDLLAITAACTGFVLRRPRLAARGLGTLMVGLAVTGAVAGGVTLFVSQFGLLPDGFALGQIPAGQTHINASTILVALSAGVAGMLAVETRASSAVGVAISVTTVPAAAYLGVGLGLGELDKSLSALSVLGANVALMLVGGACALVVQRAAKQFR